MRPLLVTALAATLMGCSFAPHQTQEASLARCTEATGLACSKTVTPQTDLKVLHGGTAAEQNEEPRHRRKANTDIKNAKSNNVAPKMDAASSVQPNNEITTSSIAAKLEIHAFRFDEQSDPAIKKAKAAIAAKMGNPASVEFMEMKWAASKNTLGNSSDIICGFVREKNGGPRPFLYHIPKDEAYIGGYKIATSPYRHICSITL